MDDYQAREQAEREWLRDPEAIADTIRNATDEAGQLDPADIAAKCADAQELTMNEALVGLMHCTGRALVHCAYELRRLVEAESEPNIAERAAELMAPPVLTWRQLEAA